MPVHRGRFFPQIESTGQQSQTFTILLWGRDWSRQEVNDLLDVETLQAYLSSLTKPSCSVRVCVPDDQAWTRELAARLGLDCEAVNPQNPAEQTGRIFPNAGLAGAVETSLACNADVLVSNERVWFPYIEECEKLGFLISDTSFVKRLLEWFVRGHDVPWSFSQQIWDLTWTGFYAMTEQETFHPGFEFLEVAQQKNAPASAQEVGRTLIHNRLPNICFTRDRLLFWEVQQRVAKRKRWRRQEFTFETAYFLNFYYMLLYGGFDHLSLVVNEALQLGLPERRVGATYEAFLERLALSEKAIHDLFTAPTLTEFIARIGALRNYAAHRGSIMPTKVVNRPDREPTAEELDRKIDEQEVQFGPLLPLLPGQMGNRLRTMMRQNLLMAYYEEQGEVVDGLVHLKLNGNDCFIHPLNDTMWNFSNYLKFTNAVLVALSAKI